MNTRVGPIETGPGSHVKERFGVELQIATCGQTNVGLAAMPLIAKRLLSDIVKST